MSSTKKIFFRSQKYTGKAKFDENFQKKNVLKRCIKLLFRFLFHYITLNFAANIYQHQFIN